MTELIYIGTGVTVTVDDASVQQYLTTGQFKIAKSPEKSEKPAPKPRKRATPKTE